MPIETDLKSQEIRIRGGATELVNVKINSLITEGILILLCLASQNLISKKRETSENYINIVSFSYIEQLKNTQK